MSHLTNRHTAGLDQGLAGLLGEGDVEGVLVEAVLGGLVEGGLRRHGNITSKDDSGNKLDNDGFGLGDAMLFHKHSISN